MNLPVPYHAVDFLTEDVSATLEGPRFVESVGLNIPNVKQQYVDSEPSWCSSNKAYLADTKDVGVPRSSLGAVEEFTHAWEAEETVESDDDGTWDTDLGGGGGPPQVS